MPLKTEEFGKQFCEEEDAKAIVNHMGYYPHAHLPIREISKSIKLGVGWCTTHVMKHRSSWAEWMLKV